MLTRTWPKIAFVDHDQSIISLPETCSYEPDKLGLTAHTAAAKRGASGSDVIHLTVSFVSEKRMRSAPDGNNIC